MPYRPFFAFPDKVRQKIPIFKYCNAFWFSVFDPPRALAPALALTPDITTVEPKVPSMTPKPTPVHEPGPRQTTTDGDPASFFAPAVHPQPMPHPKDTGISSNQDPAISKPSPIDQATVVPNANVQKAGQSADSPIKNADPSDAPAEHGVESPTAAQSTPQDEDPDQEPGLQGKSSPPTTIQLGPQPNGTPTTIFIGGKIDAEESTSGMGALIFNALGRVDPTAKSDGVSDPEASISDLKASYPTIRAAGQLLTISDPSAVAIAGTVLSPGGAEVTIAGTPISLAPSGNLIVGTGPFHPSSTVLTIAGHTVTANPTSFQIAGTPVKAGGPAVTLSGTAISIGLSGDLVIGGSAGTISPLAAVFTIGTQPFTADGAGLVGSGTTIRAGGPAVLVAGTKVSLGSSGALVLGSTTTTLSGVSLLPTFTVGGQTFTANPTGFIVAGVTLSAGGPGITANGTLISLDPSGSLVIGTSTIPLPTPTSAVITTDGQVLTVESDGSIAVDGVTLSSGGPGTIINGTAVSLGSGGIVIGSDMIPLPTLKGSASSTLSLFKGAAPKSAELSRFVLFTPA